MNAAIQWATAADTAGQPYYRIICLDDKELHYLRKMGIAALSYYDLIPDASKIEHPISRQRFWYLRVQLFLSLAEQGINFIHSDADALWLKDPRPWLLGHAGHDILFSQGTLYFRPLLHKPPLQWKLHTFPRETLPLVVCAGFFLAYANHRTKNYFTEVAQFMEEKLSNREKTDDQFNMNRILRDNPKLRWHVSNPVRIPCYHPQEEKSILLIAKFLSIPVIRKIFQKLIPVLLPKNYIVISRELMHTQLASGLKVGVLPMHLFTRKPAQITWSAPDLMQEEETLVLHDYAYFVACNQVRHPKTTEEGRGIGPGAQNTKGHEEKSRTNKSQKR